MVTELQKRVVHIPVSSSETGLRRIVTELEKCGVQIPVSSSETGLRKMVKLNHTTWKVGRSHPNITIRNWDSKEFWAATPPSSFRHSEHHK